MKITKQQYINQEIHTISISGCSKYLKWFTNHPKCHSEPYNLSMSGIMFGDNRELFKKVFGKPDWYFKGSEFYVHVRVLTYENETYLLFTAKDKGTCIEMLRPTDKYDINERRVGRKIISFIEHLYATILPCASKELENATAS